LFCGDCPATAVVLLLKLGENEVCFGKKKQPDKKNCPAAFPFPACKIAFLFGKTQGLQVNR
jgi:hypothetical protein